MTTFLAYVKDHRLGRRYAAGLLLVLAVPLLLTLMGEPAAHIAIKTVASIPVVIALLSLPSIFGDRSNIPLSPSFIERGALTGLILASWIAVLSWAPEMEPVRLFILVALGFATYFGLHMLTGLRRRH